MALNSLPKEILDNILSSRAHNRKDLWSCSLVSRTLWEAATSILYSNVDLRVESQWRDSALHLEKEKATTLVKTLASNPTLGAKVRTFSVCFPNPSERLRDEYMAFGQEDGDRVAHNISFLTKAELMESGLTHHIIANMTAYPHLRELSLRLVPKSNQWGDKPTPLETLRWEVPANHFNDSGTIDPWNTAANIFNIIGAVFPEIVQLDISDCRRSHPNAAGQSLSQRVIEHRQNVLLPRLQSFCYRGEVHDTERELMLDFVRRNHEKLTSLAMTTGIKVLDQRMMEYILRIVTAAPRLKYLAMTDRFRAKRWQSHRLPTWSDPMPLLIDPTHGIEFFEMWDIGCSFSPAIGQFFSGWNNLRVLKIGAPLYEEHAHDGRPHFDNVANDIQGFIKGLPRSIEEIFIELDNCQLVCDEDEDFNPIVELLPEIFKALIRLHTLDINAWIADIDVSTGHIPEKAVFCRRRPSEQDPDNEKKKIIWASRLESIYQEDYANLSNGTIEVEGDFKGKDADEPWLGGERSWVSQSSRHWSDGKYLLGADLDPYDPDIRYNSDDAPDDEED